MASPLTVMPGPAAQPADGERSRARLTASVCQEMGYACAAGVIAAVKSATRPPTR